ncbi:MAG: 1-acyl-sn-glycerol-3-phosphate acyltransferase [Nitriliruptor sp.]|nr:MAG: 1-acyl-sn-glycerol-3-phosphate acyltransferase [Nitriliruptor sp.]
MSPEPLVPDDDEDVEPIPFTPMVPGAKSMVRRTLRPALKAWLRLTVEGADHVPQTGAVLVASTHQSHADSLAIGVAIHRPVHFLGDLHLTTFPVVGSQLPKLGMVPLKRGEADGSAMDVLGILLDDEACVAVYPEGSRSRDGRVHRLRSGVARLAANHQVPVVPASVDGIHDVWPIGSKPRLRGGRVTVRFGPAMAPPEPTPRSRRAFNDTLQVTLADLAGTTTADDFSPFHGGDDA